MSLADAIQRYRLVKALGHEPLAPNCIWRDSDHMNPLAPRWCVSCESLELELFPEGR